MEFYAAMKIKQGVTKGADLTNVMLGTIIYTVGSSVSSPEIEN